MWTLVFAKLSRLTRNEDFPALELNKQNVLPISQSTLLVENESAGGVFDALIIFCSSSGLDFVKKIASQFLSARLLDVVFRIFRLNFFKDAVCENSLLIDGLSIMQKLGTELDQLT